MCCCSQRGTLALGSGLFFGLWRGFAVNVAGNLLSALAAMALSRRFGRGWIRRALLRRPKWAALDEAVGREGWKIIFLSQLIPFAPSSLLNYLFGVTRVRLRTALFWSALGQAPTMFVYAYLGTFAKFGIGLLRGTAQARRARVLHLGGRAAPHARRDRRVSRAFPCGSWPRRKRREKARAPPPQTPPSPRRKSPRRCSSKPFDSARSPC